MLTFWEPPIILLLWFRMVSQAMLKNLKRESPCWKLRGAALAVQFVSECIQRGRKHRPQVSLCVFQKGEGDVRNTSCLKRHTQKTYCGFLANFVSKVIAETCTSEINNSDLRGNRCIHLLGILNPTNRRLCF